MYTHCTLSFIIINYQCFYSDSLEKGIKACIHV